MRGNVYRRGLFRAAFCLFALIHTFVDARRIAANIAKLPDLLGRK
jgi:hypothetical protein